VAVGGRAGGGDEVFAGREAWAGGWRAAETEDDADVELEVDAETEGFWTGLTGWTGLAEVGATAGRSGDEVAWVETRRASFSQRSLRWLMAGAVLAMGAAGFFSTREREAKRGVPAAAPAVRGCVAGRAAVFVAPGETRRVRTGLKVRAAIDGISGRERGWRRCCCAQRRGRGGRGGRLCGTRPGGRGGVCRSR
jgi:hypothetical protein